jgi:hypothetical protein
MRDFVADLARARKGFLEEKKNGGLGLWEQGLEKDSNLCYLKEI